jgi:hypothetical protein
MSFRRRRHRRAGLTLSARLPALVSVTASELDLSGSRQPVSGCAIGDTARVPLGSLRRYLPCVAISAASAATTEWRAEDLVGLRWQLVT